MAVANVDRIKAIKIANLLPQDKLISYKELEKKINQIKNELNPGSSIIRTGSLKRYIRFMIGVGLLEKTDKGYINKKLILADNPLWMYKVTDALIKAKLDSYNGLNMILTYKQLNKEGTKISVKDVCVYGFPENIKLTKKEEETLFKQISKIDRAKKEIDKIAYKKKLDRTFICSLGGSNKKLNPPTSS